MNKLKFILGVALLLCLTSALGNQRVIAVASQSRAPAPQTVRHEIHDILTDQRFAYPDNETWLKKLWSALARWIAGMMRRQPAKKPPFGALATKALNYFGLFLLILVPFALAFLIPRFFQKEAKLKSVPTTDAATAPNVAQLLQNAAAQAGQGFVLEAVRLVYWAVLEYLKNQALLQRRGNDSDYENLKAIRKACGANHPIYVTFSQLVHLFQEKWYGLKSCQTADYENALALAKTILSRTGRS